MQRKSKQNNKSVVAEDFVTVAFAEDMELARQYKEMLDDNGIQVRIKRQPSMAESGFSDIAITVPEEFLDEAHTLISEKASYDDFFDMCFHDECEKIDSFDFDIDDDELY